MYYLMKCRFDRKSLKIIIISIYIINNEYSLAACVRYLIETLGFTCHTVGKNKYTRIITNVLKIRDDI